MPLAVSEIFFSIEGETSCIGLPCAFIRLVGCNLDCAWCDTEYARSGGMNLQVDEACDKLLSYGAELVCVTGGEPLLQPDTIPLLKKLIRAKKKVLLETNGSLPLEDVPRGARIIMDVKTPSSGEDKSFFAGNLKRVGKNVELKFVAADRKDFDWSAAFVKKNKLIGKCELLMSPASIGAKSSMENKIFQRELAGWVLTSGVNFRYNIQLHKILWGRNARGV